MDHINIEKLGSWVFVSLASVTTIFCFVFLLRNRHSKQTKENAGVLLCSISSLILTVCYAFYDLHYNNNENLQINRSICLVVPILHKSSIATSRCLCTLIFAYRYKTVNNRISFFAVKKAQWFSVGIIVVTALQTIFDVIWFIATKDLECFHISLKSVKRIYIISIGSLHFLVTVFQTIIMCEIIKPIFKHCTRQQSSALSRNNARRSFYRVLLSSLVFSLTDFGSIAVFLSRAILYEVRTPIIVVINTNINTLALMCSYENYKARLFPFLCCLETNENNRNRLQCIHNSIVSKKIKTSSKNSSNLNTIDANTQEGPV